jgi:hypothetical protein
MIDSFRENSETADKCDGAIARCGDKQTIEDFVVCKRVEGTDRLMVENETNI